MELSELQLLSLISPFLEAIIPIGTIVASVSEPDTFCQSYFGLPSIWTPADGRAVPGSAYSDRFGQPAVPDLRGVFLRGLNYSSTGSYRTDGFQDPDSKPNNFLGGGVERLPGTSQGDTLRSHQHGLEYKLAAFAQGGGSPNFNSSIFNEGAFNISGQPGVQMAGQAETRPKNVAVFYYIRIN